MLTRPEELTDVEWAWVQHFHNQYPKCGIRRLILAARRALAREGALLEYLKRQGGKEGDPITMTVEMSDGTKG